MLAIIVAIIVAIVLCIIFIPCSWREKTPEEKYYETMRKEIKHIRRIEMKKFLLEYEKSKNKKEM